MRAIARDHTLQIGSLFDPFPLAGGAAALEYAEAAGSKVKEMADQEQIEDLVAANRILSDQGVVDGFGHVSVRHEEDATRFLLARSMAPGLVTADDILEFDLDGNALDPQGRTLYVERFIHSEIYKAYPEIKAIVHSHSPSIIPFGVTNVPLRPIYHMSSFLGAGVPIFEIREAGGPATDMLIRNPALGAALARSLGKSAVVLMRGHGNVVVGDLDTAGRVSRHLHRDQRQAPSRGSAARPGRGQFSQYRGGGRSYRDQQCGPQPPVGAMEATSLGSALSNSRLPQCFDHCGEMGRSRAVEPFEPILIEERGKRRLPQRRFPDDPEQRSRRLVRLALQRRRSAARSAASRSRVSGPGPSPNSTSPRRSGGASTKWAISCKIT